MEDNQVQQVEQGQQEVSKKRKKQDNENLTVLTATGPLVVDNQDIMKLIKELQNRIIKLENHTHPGNGSLPEYIN